MEGYAAALALAALPAGGNFLGGVLGELFGISERALSSALHAATGIVVAVVGLELMPAALGTDRPWIPILALMLGGPFYLAIDAAIERLQRRSGGGGDTSAWAIWFGAALDLFSDGLMIGTGALINPQLGLLLALGQMPADIPEGLAAIGTFRRTGVGRSGRLALSAAFALPILLGVTLGYYAVRGRPEILKLSLLGFTGGALLAVTIEELVPEAHRERDVRLDAIMLTAGFALYAAISAYIGG